MNFPSFVIRKGTCVSRQFNHCLGYKSGKLNKPCWHIEQKGVDVRFSVDLVSLAWDKRIDKAILITGDSDFIPAIENAKEAQMKVILYFLNSKTDSIRINNGLFYLCDERYTLTKDFFNDCLMSITTGHRPVA